MPFKKYCKTSNLCKGLIFAILVLASSRKSILEFPEKLYLHNYILNTSTDLNILMKYFEFLEHIYLQTTSKLNIHQILASGKYLILQYCELNDFLTK